MHLAPPIAISTLVASVLSILCDRDRAFSGPAPVLPMMTAPGWYFGGSAAVVVYAVTMFTVTAGVGGRSRWLPGHMAATICWIAMAAAHSSSRCGCMTAMPGRRPSWVAWR